jgi:hypothetical protein
MQPAEPPFDPLPLLRALLEAEIDFVVIGGVAAGAHGSAFGTIDLDVAYARERKNLEHLAALLKRLGARLRGPPADVPFQLDADALEAGGNFTFTTEYGNLDLLAYPAGAPSYAQLRAAARPVEIGNSIVYVASLDDLIAMKEAAGRPKDKSMALELRLLSDELRLSGGT